MADISHPEVIRGGGVSQPETAQSSTQTIKRYRGARYRFSILWHFTEPPEWEGLAQRVEGPVAQGQKQGKDPFARVALFPGREIDYSSSHTTSSE
ncbi:MAG: hypothetical protein Kow0031_04760 [Anaerolineae bacterium]